MYNEKLQGSHFNFASKIEGKVKNCVRTYMGVGLLGRIWTDMNRGEDLKSDKVMLGSFAGDPLFQGWPSLLTLRAAHDAFQIFEIRKM